MMLEGRQRLMPEGHWQWSMPVPFSQGWRVGNLDCVVIAEQPRIAPYIEAIRASIARLLDTEPTRVNVKGKTTERLGFIGRGEAIAASAVVLLLGR